MPAVGLPIDGELQAFAQKFFRALGAACQEVRPDLWRVELTPEQKSVIAPLPEIPWWAAPPPPPEPATWWIAFSHSAAADVPHARLLTRNSYLFQQMRHACSRMGLAFVGSLIHPRAYRYRPVLWLYIRLRRRSSSVDASVLEPWACSLSDGRIECVEPPPLIRLTPGPPPAGKPVDRVRLTGDEVWRALLHAVIARAEGDAQTIDWALQAWARLREEEREVEHYFRSLESDEAGEDIQEERLRRLTEIRGRHFPRLLIQPVGATLVYMPLTG